MATKVHYKSYFSEHPEMINLNDDTSKTWHPFYLSNTMNEHFNNGYIQTPVNRYSEFDKEMLKRTMLEHEAIFRKQVYELHRLYKTQKTLMEEFMNNGSSKLFKLKDSSKETLCSSQLQSEWARRMLQISPLPDNSSIQKREKAGEINKNISPTSFHQSIVQCSFSSLNSNGQQKAADSNTSFGKCSKTMFDLELPADAYIDGAERLQDIPGSPSINPCSGICNESHETKLKLDLASPNGFTGRENCRTDYNDSVSLFTSMSKLNKPQKETSSPEELFGSITQPGENLGYNSLRSTKLCLQSSFSNDGDRERGASNKFTPDVEQKVREGLSKNNEAGKHRLTTFANQTIQKEKHPMSCEPIQMKERRVNESILTDCIETLIRIGQGQDNGSQISEEFPKQSRLENSVKQTSIMPNLFPSSPQVVNNMAYVPKAPSWRKPSGDSGCHSGDGCKVGRDLTSPMGPKDQSSSPNDLYPGSTPNSSCRLQLNFPFTDINLNVKNENSLPKGQLSLSDMKEKCESLDTNHYSSQVDLRFKKMDRCNERKTEDETNLPSSNLRAFSSVIPARESGEILNLVKIQNSGSSSNQHNLVVNESEQVSRPLSMVNNTSKPRMFIDLNHGYPFVDEPESAEFKGMSQTEPRDSDPVSFSGAVQLLNLETPLMSVQENTSLPSLDALVTDAAANIIKLSLDRSKHKDNIETSPTATIPSNTLDWFAEVILSNTESFEAPDDGLDLFELMTLKLEEMKPELLHCRTQEIDISKDIENAKPSILLGKLRRAQGKKRRQKKDFQKDVLPGLATLSRQEAIEDLQTIGELMKESGTPLHVTIGRRSTGRKGTKARARRRRRPRTPAVGFTVVHIGSPTGLFMAKNNTGISEYKVDGKHILGWGSKTRRCRSQRCSPIRFSTTLI